MSVIGRRVCQFAAVWGVRSSASIRTSPPPRPPGRHLAARTPRLSGRPAQDGARLRRFRRTDRRRPGHRHLRHRGPLPVPLAHGRPRTTPGPGDTDQRTAGGPPSLPGPDASASGQPQSSWSPSATAARSRAPPTWPPTPASRRRPRHPEPRSTANTHPEAETGSSNARCSSQRSPPCTMTPPAPITTAAEPVARPTPRHFCASPATASASCSPCSETAPSTSPAHPTTSNSPHSHNRPQPPQTRQGHL